MLPVINHQHLQPPLMSLRGTSILLVSEKLWRFDQSITVSRFVFHPLNSQPLSLASTPTLALLLLKGCARPHPLQQLALHQWFDHIVGGGEVPGLVDEVHCLESGREGVLAQEEGQKFERRELKEHTLKAASALTCSMSTIFLSSVGLMPDACCMVKPLKFSMMQKPLICVSSFSSSFSRMTQ